MLICLTAASNMSLGAGLMMSLLGVGIVFLVLVFLMLFISVMSRILNGSKKTAEPAPVQAEPVPAAAPALAKGSCGEVKLFDVDDRTAAMLMAIVADKMQKPLNELRFVSMRELNEE